MAKYLSPFSGRQFLDANGNPYSGAKLFTYVAGTSTKVTVYKDSAGSSSHANPIILNTRGEPADGAGATQPIWQDGGGALVKYVLAPSTDTDPPVSPIATWDNIPAINDSSIIDQWLTGPAPTYISATSFSVSGDYSSTFHVGRRVKSSNSGGTRYSVVSAVSYAAGVTTVTVTNDSGSLDSGLSTVWYGLLSATNHSVPVGATFAFTGNNTHAGTESFNAAVALNSTATLTGASIIEANASVAAHATTANIWSSGNYVTLTGAALTFTNFAAAPQAGATVEVYCNDTHTFTNNANIVIDGGVNFTASVGDRVRIRAKTTTVFTLQPIKASGYPVLGRIGKMELLSSSTASSSATIDFTGLTSSYDVYKVFGVNIRPATNAVGLWLRYSTDGGSTFKAGASDYIDGSGVASTKIICNTTAAGGTPLSNASSASYDFELTLSGINSTNTFRHTAVVTGVQQDGGGTQTSQTNTGTSIANMAAVVNAIRFLMSSGNIAEGTFYLYGIKNT